MIQVGDAKPAKEKDSHRPERRTITNSESWSGGWHPPKLAAKLAQASIAVEEPFDPSSSPTRRTNRVTITASHPTTQTNQQTSLPGPQRLAVPQPPTQPHPINTTHVWSPVAGGCLYTHPNHTTHAFLFREEMHEIGDRRGL